MSTSNMHLVCKEKDEEFANETFILTNKFIHVNMKIVIFNYRYTSDLLFSKMLHDLHRINAHIPRHVWL